MTKYLLPLILLVCCGPAHALDLAGWTLFAAATVSANGGAIAGTGTNPDGEVWVGTADAGITLAAVGIMLGVNRAVRLFLNGPAHDRSLVLPGGDQRDLPGVEDRSDTHGDGLGRDIGLTEEIGRGVLTRDGVERDQAGPGLT